MRRPQTRTSSPYDIAQPTSRRLRIYSIDPSLAQSLETHAIRVTRIEIPWEDGGEKSCSGIPRLKNAMPL